MSKSNYKSNAKVVDGKLILSFPNALNPVVWQMDLHDAKASALEVNENKDVGYDLVLKTLKGETVHVASFEDKQDSVDGLMAASKAMEGGGGSIVSRSGPSCNIRERGKGVFKGALWVVGALVVIFVLMNILSALTSSGGGRTSAGLASAPSAPVAQPSGVPVSADDFLRGR